MMDEEKKSLALLQSNLHTTLLDRPSLKKFLDDAEARLVRVHLCLILFSSLFSFVDIFLCYSDRKDIMRCDATVFDDITHSQNRGFVPFFSNLANLPCMYPRFSSNI